MSGQYCRECKALAIAAGRDEPICRASAFLGSQADALDVSRELVQNYPVWVNSFLQFLTNLRIMYNGCPNSKFKNKLYSSEGKVGKS